MNTPYEMSEANSLLEKLLELTRHDKIRWSMLDAVPRVGPITRQYLTPLKDKLEVSIWENNRAAGFRLIERNTQEPAGMITPGIMDRDLVSISIEHDHEAGSGPIYIMLMALLELARRTVDKVEPKVDRVKQYLDELAS